MPKNNEYHLVTTLPPMKGSISVMCSVLIHDEEGEPLTKRSAMALVNRMALATPDTTAVIQKRHKRTDAEWYTVKAYRADREGRMLRAPFSADWHPRFL